MPVVETFVEVHGPVGAVYNQWLQFESFPRFMEGVEKVEQLDDGRIHWRAAFGAQKLEWHSEIVENVPERKIVWRSSNGPQARGAVMLRPVGAEHTRVTLRLEYDPDGYIEDVGKFLVMVCRRIDEDLGRFRDLVERQRLDGGSDPGDRPRAERRRIERRRAA